ncbi:uncharacterized protein LOC129233744 isoform X2 [Uloborus diversus]|uniref:uncharacterized protein LOC129233744 isoform X2 n=1 Tax=Uloborus diversus TaxID=327109 RepID=UPI00240A4B10|nr:uncharacterized protein LOC129233744 isoform X2 [Uloborus diversus]
MDSINIAVKNALKFISLIQNVCDEKRLLMEQKQIQEFNCFSLEWKNKQKTGAKKTCEEFEIVQLSAKEEIKEDELLPEEEEALILADSLLEKARSIRSKNKVTLKKKLEGTKNHKLQADASNSNVSIISSNKLECLLRIANSDYKLSEKKPPRSKSSTLPLSQKTNVVPRSKSGITLHAPGNMNKRAEICLKKNSFTKEGGKCAKETNAVVVSALTPSVHKLHIGKICLKYKPREEKQSTSVCSNISEDVTQNAKKNCDEEHPTMKCFIQELKSQEYLLSKLQCKSFCSFQKAYQLVHRLQETMFWIEFFCLIAKEILPHLLEFDGSDLNRKKLCNYFKSIFVSASQRLPMFISK